MNRPNSFRIFASSGALAGGETSVVTFNGATLTLENFGKSKIRITGFTVYGNLQSGANIFLPVDQIMSLSLSSGVVNDKEGWAGSATGAAFYSQVAFSGVFDRSCTYIKYDGPVMNSTDVMTIATRATNLAGVIAGDTVNTNVVIHYEIIKDDN